MAIMYRALQEQVQPRMLIIMLVSIIFLTLISSYLYVIKKPFLGLRQHQQTLSLLQGELQTGIPLQHKIKTQQQLVENLNQQLHGTGPKLPVNKMIAYVIGELDKIASRHQVNLSSVKPQTSKTMFSFKELPFQIEISGDYFNLFSWLKDVEHDLGPIVIKQFDISPLGRTNDRKMQLTIVAYQFEDSK